MPYVSSWQIISFPTIDMKATGSQAMTTTENGTQRFVPMFLHLETVALTGTLLTGATFSMGTNSPNYDNIISSTSLSTSLLGQLTGVQQLNCLTASATRSIGPNTAIYLRISVAAIGPSVLTARPDLIGYYV